VFYDHRDVDLEDFDPTNLGDVKVKGTLEEVLKSHMKDFEELEG